MSSISRRKFIPLVGTALVGAASLSFENSSKKELAVPMPILPKQLKKGDTIGIAATAGPIRNKKEVSEFQAILHQLGYKTKLGKNLSLIHI